MFARFKVGTKIISGFLFLTVLGATVAAVGLFNLAKMNTLAERMYEQELLGLSYIKEANINLIYVGRARGNYLLSTTAQERQTNLDNIGKYMAAIKDYLGKAQPLFVTDEAKRLFAEYARTSVDYERELAGVFTLAAKEDLATRSAELSSALTQTRAHANTLDDLLTKLSHSKENRAKEAAAETGRMYASSRDFMIVLTLCSALAGVAIGVLITRDLTRQLGGEPRDAATIAAAIAAGDLGVPIPTRTGDTSSMMVALQRMRDSLAGIVGRVRAGTDTIATASAQVAAGSQDLSSRTEQQASSLEETASSMEELTSTVKGNADNAQQANALAARASEVAIQGGDVIREVVSVMDEINESSGKVVDIISVIDGIAFQTNILALNAAVEAARAGEQGRGFAVVASEVRTLAQRSAAAAKEIKALIGTSVEKVDSGSQLVARAGKTMDDIVDSVRHVSEIMREISSATQEQTSGIEQINMAVAQMDQVTQQNAALVEEAAAASESMQEEAARLAKVVSVFRLAGAGADAGATAPARSAKRVAVRAPAMLAGVPA
ncbi:methyl-accepting chemotaxis protein [Massilia sp. 9I]|uniref:methyl-accepting chemotaxis protein n=1 Tax=Massilia sp. 9I TaxID=2653152 RepID=UPI0012F26914|nr:methyl-accepting chemotaxis protein [Massilia sp. 9I]VXB18894.1 Methyl-accepting chemotaxis serine transducer [Massilia sp. 9I]